MKNLNIKLLVISFMLVFTVYAGETNKSDLSAKNTDTLKTAVNTESKYTAEKTSTTSKVINPTKTNWSKIKDLFM